jgi:SAM-dependent methyltransferase
MVYAVSQTSVLDVLRHHNGAEDGIRTRDPHLGKVMRYRCATSALAYHFIASAIRGTERRSCLDLLLRCPRTAATRSCSLNPPARPGPARPTGPAPAEHGPSLARFSFVRQDETTATLSRSFGAVADDYDRLRPGPSPEALDWLLPEGATDVLEIGAGTGILTRLLAERVAHVTAVEPDERMRAVLAAGDSGIEILAGRAEEIPTGSSSFDAVIAASAWHWVDEARGVPEVARVLRPRGRLSLVWSGPDRSVDWMRSLWAGGIVFSPEEKAAVDERRRRRHVVNVDVGGASPFLEPETRLFRWTKAMTKSDLVALSTTYSAVITMDEETRRRHLEAMARFLDTHEDFAGVDLLEVPMRSYCWRATKR